MYVYIVAYLSSNSDHRNELTMEFAKLYMHEGFRGISMNE